MQCMCAQTRPRFILSSERVLREWSQNSCNSRGKYPLPEKFSSEEDRTHDAASSRKASPTHYHLSYSGPNQRRCIKQDKEPNTLPTELFRPPLSTLGAGGTGVAPRFPRSSYTSDLKTDSLLATALGAWRDTVSGRTGWPFVSQL